MPALRAATPALSCRRAVRREIECRALRWLGPMLMVLLPTKRVCASSNTEGRVLNKKTVPENRKTGFPRKSQDWLPAKKIFVSVDQNLNHAMPTTTHAFSIQTTLSCEVGWPACKMFVLQTKCGQVWVLSLLLLVFPPTHKLMPSLSHQTPTRRSRAPLSTKREVTPNRSDKNSPDPAIDAQIAKDVDLTDSHRPDDFAFIWREDVHGNLSRSKVRKRFCCCRDLKCHSSPEEWREIVDWANSFSKTNESESTNMSEFSHARFCFCLCPSMLTCIACVPRSFDQATKTRSAFLKRTTAPQPNQLEARKKLL